MLRLKLDLSFPLALSDHNVPDHRPLLTSQCLEYQALFDHNKPMSNRENDNILCLDDLIESVMEPSDLDDVMNVERFSFNPPWTKTMFLDELSNSHSYCLTYRHSDQLVAFMCFWIILDEAHLLNIAVSPNCRGRGIGTHMIKRLIDICKKKEAHRIILDVARRNQAARTLYRKAGFNSIGFRKRYYSSIEDDAIVMEKWIGNNLKKLSP